MIIGLSGYARVGKDTVADYLVEKYGYKRIAFADPIRKALYALNPKIDVADMRGVYLASAVDGLGWETLKSSSSDTRELLQLMGTEVGRNMFGKDFWVEQAFRDVYSGSKVVFTDVRFPNEYSKIKSYYGKLIRIEKPGISAVNAHVSEMALDNYEFSTIVNNNGSIEDLHIAIDNLMN